MKARHEIKYFISLEDYYSLKARLPILLERDSHSNCDGTYFIRSLYFDTIDDKALYEKINGTKFRIKYRIRYYNFDTSYIMLEKKMKINNASYKTSDSITVNEVKALLEGDYKWMNNPKRSVVYELYLSIKNDGMRPKTIIDYTREAFKYGPGNVRVTLDHHIRTSINGLNFLDKDEVTIPIRENTIIMEVKWDEYLPDIVKCAVSTPRAVLSAFSKYANGRVYDF